MLKYLINRTHYPLFTINSSGKGLRETKEMLHRIKMCKIVQYRRKSYFSLSVPHWPSRAFDSMVANGGLNITAAGTPLKKQIDTVILAVTPRCQYRCVHCYEHFNLSDHEKIPVAKLIETICRLQKHGVSIITLSGGEPMLRFDDVITILNASDKRASDFHIHTSGYDVTLAKACRLRKAGLQAAGIGIDDIHASRNDAFRGYKGAFLLAKKAIKCFQEAGVFTYVNTCPTKELIRSGDIYRFIEMIGAMKVGIIRLLEPRPCGAFLSGTSDGVLDEEDKDVLRKLYIACNTSVSYRDYPLICYDAFAEAPENMGCMMAGHSHFYINSSGDVQPCVFLPVSFGNIMQQDLQIIFQKMREAIPAPMHTICPSLQLSQAIRNKMNGGIAIPVPYSAIKQEFELLKQP